MAGSSPEAEEFAKKMEAKPEGDRDRYDRLYFRLLRQGWLIALESSEEEWNGFIDTLKAWEDDYPMRPKNCPVCDMPFCECDEYGNKQ